MYTPIEFDGGRRLRCDISAIQEIEQLTGKPLGTVLADLQSMGIQTLIVALYACLKHDEPTLNLHLVRKRVQKLVDEKKGIKRLFGAVSEALTNSGVFEGLDDEDEVPARPRETATTDA